MSVLFFFPSYCVVLLIVGGDSLFQVVVVVFVVGYAIWEMSVWEEHGCVTWQP